ncbi:MAG: T9SS type A sorting domain-containing protein [Bacteroidia bacterium]|nr:T9SS type A sorting domain-containing protein [Bacteroidia bacterium]
MIQIYFLNNCFRTTLLVFLFYSPFGIALRAQSVANYSVTRTTGTTYTSIAGTGNSFIWRSTTGGATNDDNRSILTPIGFDFWYLGIRYTNFSASTNGFIDFSTSTNVGTAGSAYGPLNGSEFSVGGTGGTMLALAPCYSDLWPSNVGTTPLSSFMKYATSGTAPNRVLTVEWVSAEIYKASPYWTTVPSFNFQVKIYETSGLIEFVYGTMTVGTASHNYALGINNFWTPAATPTASQHLTQQTANTTSFAATPQDALTTYPTSDTKLSFTPPAPSAAPSTLSFSNVAKGSMDLYWTDNASNELGYVILNSTDNVNFSFVSQLAAGAGSAAVTSLSAGTTYYWRVHAVTEGDLGTALTGTQATIASGTIISVATGNWNTSATWNCTCVPTSGDYVTVANGHTVTLDVNGSCRQLTVGQGTSGQLTIGSNATGRNLVVGGDLIINNGATMTTGNSNATHQMTVTGNVSNAGTFNLSPTANRVCNVTFNKDGSQTISGAGATTFFNRITMNMGSSLANILDITSSNFGVRPTNFLTLTNGTFKLSSPAGTITPFTGAITLTTTTAIWLNNASSVLSFGNSLTVFSYLRCSAGTMNVGDANNENLIVNGGAVNIDGGTINVAGRFARFGLTARIDFNLSSGSLVVGTVGSTTGSEAIFRLDELGSTYTMSGGTITLRRPGAGNLGWVNTSTTNVSVTGGTIYANDASSPASQTISINSAVPIQNLVVGSGVPVVASLLTNSLALNNGITIAASSSVISNNLAISLRGDWQNDGGFSAGTSSVIFNGTSAQSILGASSTTFNSLNISNASGVTCSMPTDITGSLTLSSGVLNTSSTNILSLESTAGATSGNSASYVNGPMEKTGTTAFVFPVGKGGRWARVGVGAPSSSTTFRAEYFNTGAGYYVTATTPTPALNNVSKLEYWLLDRTVGTGNAVVSLYWEDASFSEITDCSTTDLRVAHFNTTTNLWENVNDAVTTAGTCTGSSAGSIVTNAVVTAFSPFTFGSLSPLVNPLPIELLEFKASLNSKQQVDVRWSTATEINNDYFTVQRSQDGINFENLGEVDAVGESHTKEHYSYKDLQPYKGISYYRLKQTDNDKTFSYSNIISVDQESASDWGVYPNPSDLRTVHVDISDDRSGEYTFQLLDVSGRVVYANRQKCVKGETNDFVLNLDAGLGAGVYTLKAFNGQDHFVSKVVLK